MYSLTGIKARLYMCIDLYACDILNGVRYLTVKLEIDTSTN